MIADSTHHQCTPSKYACKPRNPATNKNDNKSQVNNSEYTSQPKLPFLKHYKYYKEYTWFKYKLGNSKESQGKLGSSSTPLIASVTNVTRTPPTLFAPASA